MAQIIRFGEFIGPGELRTARYLENHLPGDWTVICNKELVCGRGSARDVDFLIVAENSIFLTEEKSWRGNIHGNENAWVLPNGESCLSPLHTVDSLSRRLAGLIRDQVPGVKDNVERHFVFGIVILSADKARSFVSDPRATRQVFRLQGCEDELKRFDGRGGGRGSIAPFRKAILNRLSGLPNRPKIPRQIGDFTITEALPTNGPVRSFRAEHVSGAKRDLKVVVKPETLDENAYADELNIITREYQALDRLASHNCVPRVDPFFSWDNDQFYVIPIHPIQGRSLRAERTDAPPSPETVRDVAQLAFSALAAIHEAGVLHRAITPDRVFVNRDRVVFTDFIIARLSECSTIAEKAPEFDPDTVYRPPECRADFGLAEPASDVYGLAASLMFWATGTEPAVEEGWGGILNALDTSLPPEAVGALADVFRSCMQEDERTRPAAKTAADRIESLQEPTAKTPGDPGGTDDLKPGTIIENQYKIIRILGSGATATTYLAEDMTAEGLCVLKVIRNPEQALRLARAEFRSLRNLHHPNLPRVFDIRPATAPFHLKLEYVQGSPLRDMGGAFRDNVDAVVKMARQVLSALEYLAEQNLIHRDVSPGNILIPDDENRPIRLIDFGLATLREQATTSVGTPRYRPPEVDRGGNWLPSCDIYSLGVVMFEALAGRVPYAVDQNAVHKEALCQISPEESEKWGDRLVEVMLRMVEPDPARRYQTPQELDQALQNAMLPPRQSVKGDVRTNPFVDELRQAFRNSQLGNPENRGLDSEFTRNTYVPTSLDSYLIPQLTRGQFSLVVLCGNPGDGKTAFIQRVGEHLKANGATVENSAPSGWVYTLNAHRFAALFDASESDGNRTSDQLVDSLLEPLDGPDEPNQPYTAIMAANDGRLINFFERKLRDGRYEYLWRHLELQIFEKSQPHPSVLVVDLKRRSLASPDPTQQSFFSRIIDEFADASHWRPCEDCVARLECPIRFNVLSFQNQQHGRQIRQQLNQLLFAVHLRRERRATVRDLRSALAFLLTHDMGCQEVHAEIEAHRRPLTVPERLYYNSAFNRSGGADLLLEAWSDLDPALLPTPKLDRHLYFHRKGSHSHALRRMFISAADRPDPLLPAEPLQDSVSWMAGLKRRFYFEGVTGDPELDMPRPSQLLPYRHFSSFARALRTDTDAAERDRLLRYLLTGISRADGLPKGAAEGGLALQIAESSNEELAVAKVFEADQFNIVLPPCSEQFTEECTDHIILQHAEGFPSLIIGLDLYELLGRATEGFLPGTEEQRALLEELAAFKNQLLARPTEEVILIENGHHLNRVTRVEQQIVLQESTA
jgi:serine/threonine protein kinase